ncbi:MAG: PLP-dependent aspartate aminotransferase family protein [Pyrinomonadaceae bacterium MAG19_C2-C3]|nr:PLP-dependent aspartate aminotransferase family protein [Pyrinomonadaceae bacterium MAG19_C2-C3]
MDDTNEALKTPRPLGDCRSATQFVHAGERLPAHGGTPVSTPVYTTATFTYDSMTEFDAVFAGDKPGYVYSRYGNPTIAALETAMTTLESGAGACAFASGMAAMHAGLMACDLAAGTAVVASQDVYGSTLELLYTVFGAFDVRTRVVDFSDLDALQKVVEETKPRVLVAETISNPLLKVCDIKACADIAHAAGARLIIDNTFASPFLCRPLEQGADFVMHSATKYLSGHCDTLGGIVVARDATDLPALVGTIRLTGGVLGTWEAHEILRGIKTLGLRMERQCTNASHIAERLAAHPRVKRIYYPLLSSPHNTTQGETLRETLHGTLREGFGGALITLVLADDSRDAAFRFLDNLRLCVRSTSLGDVFTGVTHPATASHRELSPAQRARFGITEGMTRISVGIEDVDDIYADIEQALGGE